MHIVLLGYFFALMCRFVKENYAFCVATIQVIN
jgi:hypothetical protein